MAAVDDFAGLRIEAAPEAEGFGQDKGGGGGGLNG